VDFQAGGEHQKDYAKLTQFVERFYSVGLLEIRLAEDVEHGRSEQQASQEFAQHSRLTNSIG
jgi:hypothetical protein